ncbi:MAG: T9SS type A sorting domain-containing protein [Candidatus Symbiothrix sp.]|jgi:hypothetical protein|nr:T9SS type A sorting domain-containing protein [Candidatus Symbiothrix sp.]
MKQTQLVFSLLLSLLFLCGTLSAQISEGGTPPSFQYAKESRLRHGETISRIVMPIDFDVQKLKAEDAANEALGDVPLNAVRIIPADLTMENSGEWSTLPNGQNVWQLTIEAPDAIAITLCYREFYIPQGGKLFIYNEAKTQVLGAYTSTANPANRGFATELVAGDVITLEYVAPDEIGSDRPRIRIEGVGYGYNHIRVFSNVVSEKYGESLDCQVNVVCSEGDEWRNQINGVTRLMMRKTPTTYSWCSGAIVNNVRGDFKPYLLTAYHCVDETDSYFMDQSQFYFHYEYANCGDTSGTASEPQSKTMIGAQLLVISPTDGGSDGALLLLNDHIPVEYDVYYNGFDVSASPPAATNASGGTIGIHHPKGDVKKISTSSSKITSTTWKSTNNTGKADAHWRIPNYVATLHGYSFPESGSSGSPLFDRNTGLIIGTLTGGNTSNCETASGRYSSYGKLAYHWNGSPGESDWMKSYLDPDNTGVTIVQGTYDTDGTGIKPVDANDVIVATKYYNLLGQLVGAQNVVSLQTGVYIVKNIHASGRVSTSKILKIAQ